MEPTILAALIGLAGTVVVAVLALVGQKIIADKGRVELFAKLDKQSELSDQRLDAKIERYQAVNNEKIESLTAEVRKHNGVVERVYSAEKEIAKHEEKIKVANHRLDDLEKRAG